MSPIALIIASLLMLGILFTLTISPTLAQPCENNGHGILGKGKQIFKQSNHCLIIENNNVPTSDICGPNSVLQNGVCVPISSTCPANTVLQNGVCVPISSTCPANTVLQNGVCVPISSTCPIGTILQNGLCFPNPTSSAPVADAGQDQTVTVGSTITLDGTGSHATTPGATIASYSWVQTAGPTVLPSLGTTNSPTTATPTYLAPSSPTILTFSLTVTDSLGQVSQPSSVTVTVVAS